ncbi:hypothetical protein KUCAC02_002371 [Chaenocephalus aceratus]|uniref:Uncharacterized protein n=1 Tax=Chaenocephalus aceratus TaxID=36190 RepID=A0ACB9XUT6_CHAAC|nr:hypothetical protein KUCAC02_002371 [Chaenocephalus aceratus]
MGKSKTTKFKRPQFNAVGLPVNAVAGGGGRGRGSRGGRLSSCGAPGELQRSQCRCEGVCVCQHLPGGAAEPEHPGPPAAGRRAGASAPCCWTAACCEGDGRRGAQSCAGFESAAVLKEKKNAAEDVANEAVNLLWNLCESSSQSLSVFNKAGLLDMVVQCLETHQHNMELAISAAHCLHTVTEDNPELLRSTNSAVLRVVESVLLTPETDMAHTLLRTLAAGTLWNMKSSLPPTRQTQALNAVVSTLSRSLDLDAGTLIPELRGAEELHQRNTDAAAESEQQAAGGEEEEAMVEEEEPKHTKNGIAADNDFSDLLPRCQSPKSTNGFQRNGKFTQMTPKRQQAELREATALLTAQQTSLEIIVNMCCSDDPSDDEWEEESSSDESDLGPDGLCDGVSNLMSPLCLSAEIHDALINHNIPEKVLKKTEIPRKEAMDVCLQNSSWKGMIIKMQRVQSRALTCLHSLISSMDADSLGGAAALQAAAQHLSTLVFGAAEIPKDEEFLEAVISAMRSLLQMIASKNITQCMTPQQLMSLSEAATRCDVVSVRVNAVAILGITGSTLAKEKGTAETLQMIGSALLQVSTKDTDLVVNGEALDALFDVFADGDEAETAAKNIALLPALKALQPIFKAKIRKEGRGKYSPQQLCVLDNIKVNLRRFIGYLEKVVKK